MKLDNETTMAMEQWIAEAPTNALAEFSLRTATSNAAKTTPLNAVIAMAKALLETYWTDTSQTSADRN